ncbi:MAG TPA: DUF1127 domain-containing protein [Bradyrhizobium sp.]|nr:DUF1127 domain-containing protein [Bradyrhizobium sp.]
MSTYTHESMINHHGRSLFSHLIETLHVWRERTRARSELTTWSDRDLQDIGKSRSDVLYEIDKPFWRA